MTRPETAANENKYTSTRCLARFAGARMPHYLEHLGLSVIETRATSKPRSINMSYLKFVLFAAFAATACNEAKTDRSGITADSRGQSESEEAPEVAIGTITSADGPGGQAGRVASPQSSHSNIAVRQDLPPLSLTMPTGMRGKWRRSAGTSVTAAQCVDSDSANMGLILTIRPDGFSRFEDGGRLIRVDERNARRIRATFDTTYADTPTQGEFVFEVQDKGQTLTEQQYIEGEQAPVLRYRRCSSG